MRLPKAAVETMLAHARDGYPFEVCGVFLGRSGSARVEAAKPVVNRETESPRVRYQIAPEDLIRIQREAREQGLELSDGVLHVVVGVEKGEKALPTAWVFRDATQSFEEEPFEVE